MKNLKRKLMMFMLALMSSAGAWAQSVQDVDLSPYSESCDIAGNARIYLEGSKQNFVINVNGDATITLAGLTIENETGPILCTNGNVKIILEEGTTNILKVSDQGVGCGIMTAVEGATTTIEGNGKLIVQGAGGWAAIGGASKMACGNIVINGGDITAISCPDKDDAEKVGAAIGRGYNGTCGDITIGAGIIRIMTSINEYVAPFDCGPGDGHVYFDKSLGTYHNENDYFVVAPAHSVTLPSGDGEAGNWSGKYEYSNGGIDKRSINNGAPEGSTVLIQYSGSKKVKTLRAKKK